MEQDSLADPAARCINRAEAKITMLSGAELFNKFRDMSDLSPESISDEQLIAMELPETRLGTPEPGKRVPVHYGRLAWNHIQGHYNIVLIRPEIEDLFHLPNPSLNEGEARSVESKFILSSALIAYAKQIFKLGPHARPTQEQINTCILENWLTQVHPEKYADLIKALEMEKNRRRCSYRSYNGRALRSLCPGQVHASRTYTSYIMPRNADKKPST